MHDSIFAQNRDTLENLVNQYHEIGVVIGDPHTVDRIAAGLSLHLCLSSLGKDVQVVSRVDPIVEFSHLFGIDRISKEFKGAVKTFTISLPYKEGEIEKVSYKIENGKLNINLFAGDKHVTFSENDIRYIKKGSIPMLIFTVGVVDNDRLGHFFDMSPDIKLVNIDHNPENTVFGDLVYADPSFSSLSEVAAKIIHDMNWPIDVDTAQNLLDGISFATSNFSSHTTTPYAFEAGSFLLKQGARRRTFKERSARPPQEDTDYASIPSQTSDSTQRENVPKDWFTPKVFRTSKQQD